MIRVAIFYLLLTAVSLLAWRRGRQDERLAAATCVAGTLLTVAVSEEVARRFGSFNIAAFVIDLVILLVFLGIALRSTRFWPMWVAGLQLVTTSVHLIRLLNDGLMSFVFGTALAMWSYPILLLIGIGAWRTTMIDRWRAARLQEGR